MAVTAYYVIGGDIQISENQSIITSIMIFIVSSAAVTMLLNILWKKHLKILPPPKKTENL